MVAAALAVCVVAGSAAADDDWVPVTAGNGHFHLLAPSTPKVETSKGDEDGTPFEQTLYEAQSITFGETASYSEYKSDKVKIWLSIFVNAIIKASEGDVEPTKNMPYERGPNDKLDGALIVVKQKEMTCRIRVAIEDVRAYTLSVCVPNGGDTKDADRALASFAITK